MGLNSKESKPLAHDKIYLYIMFLQLKQIRDNIVEIVELLEQAQPWDANNSKKH